MGTIQPMNTYNISSFSHSCCYNFKTTIQKPYTKTHGYSRPTIRAMTMVRDGQPEVAPSQEPPSVSLAFVSVSHDSLTLIISYLLIHIVGY